MRSAERQDAIARAWGPYWCIADHLRRLAHAVDDARARATVLGLDESRTWRLLELDAAVEREKFDVEAALDEILASGRLA
jgi:hypothetical protein